MALPYNTFTQSVAHMERLTSSKVTTTDLGAFYNNAHRQILQSHQWSTRVGETAINTISPYTTGTVTTVQGTNVVTGASTVWTATHECGFIRISNDDAYYKIAAVNSGTALTLEVPWPATAVSGASYEIFGLYYAMPTSAARVLSPLAGNGVSLIPRSLAWLSGQDPARRSVGGIASVWLPHGVDSVGRILVEFWPRYRTATTVRVFYEKRMDDLTGGEIPLVRNDIVEAQALAYAFTSMYSKFGDERYSKLALMWEQKFTALREEAIQEDMEKHNLPGEVQDEQHPGMGWDFFVTHDVS